MSDDAKDWRWVGEDGAQKPLTEEELVAELSSESLPNYSLVWRRGWAEWLPAMQVAELAWALPAGKADDPVEPKEKAGANSPPAPPLYRYPVIKRRAQNLKPDRPPPERPKSGAPRPGAPSMAGDGQADDSDTGASSPEPLTSPRSERPPPPAPDEAGGEFISDALDPSEFGPAPSAPDVPLDSAPPIEPDEEIVEVDAQLDESRPTASDTAVGAHAYADDDNAETRVLHGRTGTALGGPTYVAPHPPPAPEPPPPSEPTPTSEFPRLPPPPAAPEGFSEFPVGTDTRRGPPPLAYGVALVIVLGLAAVLVFGGDTDSVSVTEGMPSASAASAVASSPTPAAPAARQIVCSVERDAKQLAASAHPGVHPMFCPVPDTTRLALGFGDGTRAYGITLAPESLDRDEVFRQKGRRPVLASIPTTQENRLSFTVVRSGEAIAPATVIGGSPPLLLGMSEGDLVRRAFGDTGEEPHTLFHDVGSDVTTPRATTVSGTGHAFTLRAGGKRGQIRVGWLTQSGSKLSELSVVETDAEQVGTPDIGGNEAGARAAFAARKPGDDSWDLQTVAVPRGAAPDPAEWLSTPPGGPGGSLISPLIAGLPKGRWLLAWTEGSAGAREVRAVVLGRDGTAAGPATRVSPPGKNAGQGALWVRGSSALVVFFVEGDERHELWGATVSCDPGNDGSKQ